MTSAAHTNPKAHPSPFLQWHVPVHCCFPYSVVMLNSPKSPKYSTKTAKQMVTGHQRSPKSLLLQVVPSGRFFGHRATLSMRAEVAAFKSSNPKRDSQTEAGNPQGIAAPSGTPLSCPPVDPCHEGTSNRPPHWQRWQYKGVSYVTCRQKAPRMGSSALTSAGQAAMTSGRWAIHRSSPSHHGRAPGPVLRAASQAAQAPPLIGS